MFREVKSLPIRNRFLAQPFEFAFATLFTVVGAGLFLSRFQIRISNVQSLPMTLVIAWAVALVVGGPLMFTGLLWRGSGHTGRALERAGLYLAIGAWVTYTLTILSASPTSAVVILQGLTVSIACAARAAELSRVDRVVERIAQANARNAEE